QSEHTVCRILFVKSFRNLQFLEEFRAVPALASISCHIHFPSVVNDLYPIRCRSKLHYLNSTLLKIEALHLNGCSSSTTDGSWTLFFAWSVSVVKLKS